MIAVILNPKSGSVTDAEQLITTIKTSLSECEIFLGTEPGDGTRNAAKAAEQGFASVIAAGGDGTLNEVLNGMMPFADRVQLGLLPLGTGNDFGRVLQMPAGLEAALEVISAGATRAFDVVRVTGPAGGRHFLNVSAGGFSGAVSEKMTEELKAAWGPLSYVRGLIEALPELSPYACQITLDDEPPIALSLFNLVVANAPYVARGIPIAPEADPTDGLLDIVAIRESPGARLALLAPAVLLGQHLAHEEVVFHRARRVRVEAVPPMPFNTDGEMIGDSPWQFELLPHAVRMLVPAN